MPKLVLAINETDLPEEGGILWQGYATKAGAEAIEKLLGENLIKIRTEHMRWACETGLKEVYGGASLQDLLECGQTPSMWWTSLIYERHPKLSPQLFTIYKLRCLETLLEERKPRTLAIIGGSRKLRASIARLCKALNIEFVKKPGPREMAPDSASLKRRVYSFLPAPVRALLRFGHWLWKIKSLLPPVAALPPLPASPGQKPAATIATYFPNIDLRAAGEGRFRSRYWESLHDALNEQAACERPDGPHFVRWLFIRFPSPDLSLQDCLKLRDVFQKEGKDGLSFNFLEEFISAADMKIALRRWLKLAFRRYSLSGWFSRQCRFAGSSLDFWPYMRGQWAESLAGWRSLERCLFNQAFGAYYKMAGGQRWNLFPLENCPWERMLTEAARSVDGNGPVFGAQHSTIRPTDFRYFDAPETFSSPVCAAFQPDIIAGNGASACDQWRDNKMPAARLAQVEALRYLYLAGDAKKEEAVSQSGMPAQPGEPLEPGAGARLLILTSFFKDETDAHLRLVKESLASGMLNGYRLILKPHPYLNPQEWLDSLPADAREKIFLSRAPLALELTEGTRVWASNSTTASLEALLRGLPVMVMRPLADFDLCPVQDVPGLVRTATLEDVKNGLANLKALKLMPDYLDLNPLLPAWRKLLDLADTKCGFAAKEGKGDDPGAKAGRP